MEIWKKICFFKEISFKVLLPYKSDLKCITEKRMNDIADTRILTWKVAISAWSDKTKLVNETNLTNGSFVVKFFFKG